VSRPHATYGPAVKAEAVALALTVGPNAAADQLGIPRRSVANWMHAPAAAAIGEATRAGIEDQLWRSFCRAVDVLSGMLGTAEHPPQGLKLGDVARTVETLLRSYQLLTGRATERLEVAELFPGISADDRKTIADFARASEAWGQRLADAGLLEAYQAEHNAANAVIEAKYAELVGEPSPLLLSKYPNLTPEGS